LTLLATTLYALQFTGKVAIVTGGSTGMGLAAAQQLAAEGAKLIIAGRTQSKLDAAVKLIKEAGGEAHAIVADVGSDEDNKRIVDTALDLYGRLDLSFINAGTYGGAGFSEVSTQQHTHKYDLNIAYMLINL
jgi:NAD(P)-dependent dehydrogenase (short-subunit alcohol dehydrogenase family)